MKNLTIIIITGLSGSGKSTAVAAFEDAGFYCVDNMPVALLPKFLELPIESDSEIAGTAFVMDLREKGFLAKYETVFDGLKREGYRFEILFLEADEQVLLQRYSTTRRQHPLSQDKGLLEGIRTEKKQLARLRSAADTIIDTSLFNVHELKAYILEYAQKSKKLGLMRINIVSFGFKNGIPHEADLIVDVRFLPNPYFIPELKALDGEAREIKDFILTRPETRPFLDKYFDSPQITFARPPKDLTIHATSSAKFLEVELKEHLPSLSTVPSVSINPCNKSFLFLRILKKTL